MVLLKFLVALHLRMRMKYAECICGVYIIVFFNFMPFTIFSNIFCMYVCIYIYIYIYINKVFYTTFDITRTLLEME